MPGRGNRLKRVASKGHREELTLTRKTRSRQPDKEQEEGYSRVGLTNKITGHSVKLEFRINNPFQCVCPNIA